MSYDLDEKHLLPIAAMTAISGLHHIPENERKKHTKVARNKSLDGQHVMLSESKRKYYVDDNGSWKRTTPKPIPKRLRAKMRREQKRNQANGN